MSRKKETMVDMNRASNRPNRSRFEWPINVDVGSRLEVVVQIVVVLAVVVVVVEPDIVEVVVGELVVNRVLVVVATVVVVVVEAMFRLHKSVEQHVTTTD